MSDLRPIFAKLWSLACQDKLDRPSCRVEDGMFVMTITGNRERWVEMLGVAGVPSHAIQEATGETLVYKWASHADAIFGPGGLMAQALPHYETRAPQLHMARMVQRAIEMRMPAAIEAGTGTGKSFAYAAICMAMGKRVAISTSNKALQMQLYRKDIPFLQTLFPGKRVALVQGKQNYACHIKATDLESGRYTIEGELLDWYLNTETGNVEEIPFAPEPEILRDLTADAYCAGKTCPRYGDCFYYESKVAREEADVLICNHMLLAMHELYPGAGILPDKVDVFVVDEAHQFAGYVQNAVGVDLATATINRRIEKLDDAQGVQESLSAFFAALTARIGNSTDREIAVPRDEPVEEGRRLAGVLYEAADELWPESDMAHEGDERKRKVDADRVRAVADAIAVFSEPSKGETVRWVENDARRGRIAIRHVPHSVARYISGMAGFREVGTVRDLSRCARCGRALTAETVAVLDGVAYGPDCIRYVDPMGDAEPMSRDAWLGQDLPEPSVVQATPTPVIFTSATLAAPDMQAFYREAGLPFALEMVADSPFDYASNALLYVPATGSPAPNHADYRDFAVKEIQQLVNAAGGGAFCLFTSFANMHYAVNALGWRFAQNFPVFVQGELPKLEIVKRFMEAGNGVLFATKSFWEGVSIDGHALRLVIIDKLPFEAPSPLNQAQEAALVQWARGQGMDDKRAGWYPFEHLRVPRMILDLKQGAGRLIRTQDDRGVIAILDARLRSAQYARRLVLPALPPAKLTHNLFEVSDFFRRNRGGDRRVLSTFAPVTQGKAVVSSLDAVSEIPF